LRIRGWRERKGGDPEKGGASQHVGHVPQTRGGKKGSPCPEMAFSIQPAFIAPPNSLAATRRNGLIW
jgi:hypothetical protein